MPSAEEVEEEDIARVADGAKEEEVEEKQAMPKRRRGGRDPGKHRKGNKKITPGTSTWSVGSKGGLVWLKCVHVSIATRGEGHALV